MKEKPGCKKAQGGLERTCRAMYIALMAHDDKKEPMAEFCTAYAGILSQYKLCATNTTGKLIAAETGLHAHLFLPRQQGGDQQIGARIAYNEMDMVIFFVYPRDASTEKDLLYLSWIRITPHLLPTWRQQRC